MFSKLTDVILSVTLTKCVRKWRSKCKMQTSKMSMLKGFCDGCYWIFRRNLWNITLWWQMQSSCLMRRSISRSCCLRGWDSLVRETKNKISGLSLSPSSWISFQTSPRDWIGLLLRSSPPMALGLRKPCRWTHSPYFVFPCSWIIILNVHCISLMKDNLPKNAMKNRALHECLFVYMVIYIKVLYIWSIWKIIYLEGWRNNLEHGRRFSY